MIVKNTRRVTSQNDKIFDKKIYKKKFLKFPNQLHTYNSEFYIKNVSH